MRQPLEALSAFLLPRHTSDFYTGGEDMMTTFQDDLTATAELTAAHSVLRRRIALAEGAPGIPHTVVSDWVL